LQNLNLHYVQPIRSFNRATRLYLAMILIDGLVYSAWQLFFNLYVLQSGYSREFLGLLNSMPWTAGLILGIPAGRLSDRIGRKPSLALGLGLSSLFMLAQVTFHEPALMAASAFLMGAFFALFLVSQAPLMMKLSDNANRTMLFSLSYGLQTVAGAVGDLFAGQLPAFFSLFLNVHADSAAAYQAVLIASILLGSTSLLPLWLMREPQTAKAPEAAESSTTNGAPPPDRRLSRTLLPLVIKMTTPQVLIGLGAAILIPYMNVFYKDRFNISDSLLGVLFSMSSLLIGIGTLVASRLTTRLGGKVRAVVATQSTSLVFLLMTGFAPVLWLSSIGFLIRMALMNMASPLYSAFCMERTPEPQQGFVNSLLNLSWNVGWSVGPFLSGVVQQRYGFAPLFIATAVLYGLSNILIWTFFRDTEKAEPVLQGMAARPEFLE
jgi:MFS family permease